MVEKLSFFVKNILSIITCECAFTVNACIVTVGLIVNLLITFFSTEYKRKNRIWFCLLGSATVLFQSGLALLNGQGLGYTLCLLALVILYCIPVFFVSYKKRKMKKEQLELVQYIDSTLKNTLNLDREINNNIQREYIGQNYQDSIQIDETKTNSKQENNLNNQTLPDFTHVNNVIERLNQFPLTPFDKKQVKELEINIATLKREGNHPEIKAKLNDGLSALLKIMSKYGV